ncbi:MAG: TolC family outer membrane protein [Azoarcus sp.]|jgi:outer membrane protein|nr:TolC family outer membrane protein [Azoarcus sp.]
MTRAAQRGKRLFAAILAFTLAGAASAADLLDIYRDALASDARHAAARAQFEAGQEKTIQGRSALLPTVALTAHTRWNDVETRAAGATSATRYGSNAYAIQITQPLLRRQNWIQAEVGALQTELATNVFGEATQALILRTAESYFNVLNARDALDAIIQLREAAAGQLVLARTSFDVGTVTITDVYEAQSRFDLASAQEIAARNSMDMAREALARLIGHSPAPLAGLRAGVELQAPRPGDIDSWVAAAIEGDFAVRTAELNRELAARALDHAQSGHLPTLDLVASYGHNHRPSTSVDRNASGVVGLELNVPLYQGGAVSSAAREALALHQKSEAELEEARRGAALAAREAYLGVSNGIAQVKALEAARLSSDSALEANRLGYEVGVRINIDVLNAQSQLADTQQRLARARYDTLLAQLRLRAVTGALGMEDLSAINALLEQAADETQD